MMPMPRIPTPRILATAVCLLALTIGAGPAAAQSSDSNVSLNAPGLLVKKPKPGLPEVKAQPQAWPRLDPGAVLCRSEADLTRLAQRRSGETVDGPVDCQIVRGPTPITIVQRAAPGRTEVRLNDGQSTASAWTDAWLPEKLPTGAKSAASR
jgi:hypothetical protein